MELAIIKLKVGKKACFLVGAIGANEGALVSGSIDEAALCTASQFLASAFRTMGRKG